MLMWREQGRGYCVWSDQSRWHKTFQSLEHVAECSCPTVPFPARRCLQELLGNCCRPLAACAQTEEENPLLLSGPVPTWCAGPKALNLPDDQGGLHRY